MPTLFRFLLVLGVITGVVAGSLYVLAEYFQPEPKEISKALRNVKARIAEETASTPVPETTGTPGAAPAPAPSRRRLQFREQRLPRRRSAPRTKTRVAHSSSAPLFFLSRKA